MRAGAWGALLLLAGLSAHAASTLQFVVPDNTAIPGEYTYIAGEGFPDTVAVFVRRSGDLGNTVGVQLATTGHTARPGVDYTELATNLVFLPGETAKAVLIPIQNDLVLEPFETFKVTLSEPSGDARLGGVNPVNVRITDNDAGLQVEPSEYSVNEDDGAVTVGVLCRYEGGSRITVDYDTEDGTAVAGVDYEERRGTLAFGAGTPVQYVAVPILNNEVRQASRQFRFSLRNPSAGVTLGSPTTATVTITDTDGVVRLARTSLAVLEDAALVRLTVTRGESLSGATVEVLTANLEAQAGLDYTGLTNTVTFAPGERLRHVALALLPDGEREMAERFRVLLRNPSGGAVLGANRVTTVTILDNDPGFGFATSNFYVPRLAERIEVQVRRGSDAWSGAFTVDYATFDGTARAGLDYETAAGTLVFGPDERVKSVPLVLLRNAARHAARSFTVRLHNLTGPLPITQAITWVTIAPESNPRTVWVRPPLRLEAEYEAGKVLLAWDGAAVVRRADSVSGPWEELGTMDSPLVPAGDSGAGFYQLRSSRTARLYVPSRYDGATRMPLVMVLHGYSAEDQILDYFGMEALAEARGFLVTHPTGTTDAQGYAFWNAWSEAAEAGVDDSGYLRGLLEEIARTYAVDRRRIYVTGHSAGGAMCYRLAGDHADLIAGIAPYAGCMELDPQRRRPSEPVHVLHIHGTADEIVSYSGQIADVIRGWPLDSVRNWAAYNGCDTPVWEPAPVLDLDRNLPGLDTVVLRYANCPPGGAVELWTIHGGVHGSVFTRATDHSEFSTRVVDWLLAHPKP